ncbi:hypothetical protein [Bradyrhizobium sp. ORS 86]|uniref:hypothetical protein n=1 Tax=Bradyrhizobium sp. ORS 86 TaxID=1685970 RepID=UPI00388DC0A8
MWGGGATNAAYPDPVASAPILYLAQSVAAPTEYAGLTKENSSYAGPAIRAVRNDNGAQQDIGFVGKNLDDAALTSFLSGTTGLVTTAYGQMGVTNFTQATTANMPLLSKDTDGIWKIDISGGSRWLESSSTAFKTAKAHCFMVAKRPYFGQSGSGAAGYTDPVECCLFAYGPSGDYKTNGRFGLGYLDLGTGPQLPQNASTVTYAAQGYPGECRMGKWSIHDLDCNTLELRIDKDVMLAAGSSVDITYPATTKLTLGADNGAAHPWAGSIRGFAFYGSVLTSTLRDQVTDFLTDNSSLGVVRLSKTGATTAKLPGFTWSPVLDTTWFTTTTDAQGVQWVNQHGSYPWSCWIANNVTNGKPLVRFETRNGDNDFIITSANRTERSSPNALILPGQVRFMFAQFMIEGPFQDQSGCVWSDIFQVHWDDNSALPNDPDMYGVSVLNNTFQAFTQSAEPAPGDFTSMGSPQTLLADTWYAMLLKITFDSNRTSGRSDGFELWFGQNGTTLTKIVNQVGVPIYDTSAINAYLKQGNYRGTGNGTNLAQIIANHTLTATDISSYVTTQPALPTHP